MNANLKLLSRVALLMLASQALTACMSTTPVWEKHFGEAVTTVSRAQVINPDAPGNLPPATGVDGKAAVAAMSNYDRSLYRLGTGGAGGTAGLGGAGFGGGGYGGVGMSGGSSR